MSEGLAAKRQSLVVSPMLRDTFGRELRDLRISVTDRCNFGCVYCRTTSPPDYLPPASLLTWDQLLQLARAFVRLGIRKIRLTGGEPLLCPGLVEFVARLRGLEGLEDLALTTNGTLLAEMAQALASAGLRRVNISVDSLRPERFASLSRAAISLPAGLAPDRDSCVCPEWDGAALSLRRWNRGDGHHCPGFDAFLWRLQPCAPDRGWKDTHLPVLPGGTRYSSPDVQEQRRPRTVSVLDEDRQAKGAAAPH
jgi:hypothetical protein